MDEVPSANADDETGTVEALWQVQECRIENNVIDLQVANPIQYSNATSVRCFNNRNSAGKLVQGYSDGAVRDELTTFIEDAAIVCLL